MNGSSFLNKGLLQGLISMILVICLVAGICLPGMNMEKAEPKDPLDAQEVLDITMLEVSENISSLTPIVVPTGGSAQPTEPQEEEEDSEVSNTEQGENGEETEATEGNGAGDKEGNEEGLQGAEGGELLPDLAVVLTWKENRTETRSLSSQPSGTAYGDVLNNSLSGGAFEYSISLAGEDVGDALIEQLSYESDSGAGALNQRGTIYMQGGTYRITVSVVVNGQRVPFHFELNHIKDVTLKMEYTLREDGRTVTREAICENTGSKMVEEVYSDQLTDGILEYAFSIVGVEGGVEITSVSCYQSGSGNTLNGLDADGEIQLLLDGGTTGENTFTVRAEGEGGTSYRFSFTVPYKPRGAEILEIEIDGLTDGQTITTGSPMNFRVRAYRPEDGRNVEIPANGTDCGITVTFDGMPVEPTSLSEYIVTPANPEIGDTREFTMYVYAEDSYGNWGEMLLELYGERAQEGQIIGMAQVYVDLNVLGLGRLGPYTYDVLADEPVSYVTKKVLGGEDLGEIYGSARESIGWHLQYRDGTGFYLEHVYTGYHYDAVFYDSSSGWPEDLAEIDAQLSGYPELAALWRCLQRNGASAGAPDADGSFGEMVYASTSGWIYTVNGQSPTLGAADYQLKDGDELVWYYTLAGGWEIDGCSGTREGSADGIGYCVHLVNGTWHLDHNWVEEDGQTMCRSCGVVQDCLHENTEYVDLGSEHVLICKQCEMELSSAAFHTWKPIEGNLTTHGCEVCGVEDPYGHFWDDSLKVVITEATCTTAGEVRYTCAECGMEKTEYPTGGHEYGGAWERDPNGQVHYQKCAKCGQEGEHIAYKFVWDDDEGDYLCQCGNNCGIIHWEINRKLKCDSTRDESRSNCQVEVLNCSCGNDLYEYGSFDNHNYENGYCIVCGDRDPEYHEHAWSGWTTVIDPDCENPGQKQRSCDCGESEYQEISALGHSWGDWYDISSASCTEGERGHTCTVCGTEETEITTPVYDHSWSDWYDTGSPTCQTEGTQQRDCSECGTWEEQYTGYADHFYENGSCVYCGTADPDSMEPEISMFARLRRKWYGGNNREERI